MESALTWEHETLINELTQGMEKARQLRFHLCTASPSKEHDLLLQKILSSYEKALLILKCKGTAGQGQVQGQGQAVVTPTSRASGSPVSGDGSPKSEDMYKNFTDSHQDHRETPKKRKSQPTWTQQAKVNTENALQGPTDDGYSWRKYGQKDILGAKYPRSYYRCTYRLVQDCWATKQVQRSDEDPTVFEITYKGTHTCSQANHLVNEFPTHSSPQKQEPENNNQNQTLSNLKANLRVETECFDNKEIVPSHFTFPECHGSENGYFPISGLADENHLGTYSSLFYSPATSDSTYFSVPAYPMNYGEATNIQNSRSEIISAHASTTNSPIGGMEFSAGPSELDPSFPFSTSGFFT